MHVDGFDMDGAIPHEGGLHLRGATKGDVIEVHHGTFRCGIADVRVAPKERWRGSAAPPQADTRGQRLLLAPPAAHQVRRAGITGHGRLAAGDTPAWPAVFAPQPREPPQAPGRRAGGDTPP